METQYKTTEKIKSFVDSVDAKIREIDGDVKRLISHSKTTYHQELESMKQQANQSKELVADMHKERLHQAKQSYDNITAEARLFMVTKLEPLNQKFQALKEDAINYSDRTDEKWQEMKMEIEELLENAKLAVYNFKETFRSHKES